MSIKHLLLTILLLTFCTAIDAQNKYQKLQNNIDSNVSVLDKKIDASAKELKDEIAEHNRQIENRLTRQEEHLELKKEIVDFRNDGVSWWLSILGIMLGVLGIIMPFLGYQLYTRITTQSKEAKQEITSFITQAKNQIKQFETHAESSTKEIVVLKKKAEKDTEKISKTLDDIGKQKGIPTNNQNITKTATTENTSLPKQVIDELNQANELFNQQQFNESNNLYKRVLDNNPNIENELNDDPQLLALYSGMGHGNFMTKNIKESINNYTKAIQISQKSTNSLIKEFLSKLYLNRAVSYIEIQSYLQAKEDLQEALNIDPENYLAYYNLGVIELNKRNPANALVCFKKALSLNNEYLNTYFQIGNSYLELNEYNKAITQYNIVLKHTPDDFDSLTNKAQALYYLAKYEEAILLLTNVITMNGEIVSAYMLRAVCNGRLQNYNKALDDYKSALIHNSENEILILNYVELNILLNNLGEAKNKINQISKEGLPYKVAFGYDIIKALIKIINGEIDNINPILNDIFTEYEFPNETDWSFIEIKEWLNSQHSNFVDLNKKELIRTLINKLEEWRS